MKKIDNIVCVLLLVNLTVVTFLQVLFRFVLNLPLDWSEETSRYTFILLVYMATSIAVKERAMIKIELINMFLHTSIQKYLYKIIDTVTAGFCFFMTYLCYTLIENSFSVGQVSPALGVPMWILYGFQLILFFLIGIRYILRLFVPDTPDTVKVEVT